ncbi:hypothetical protein FNV43_RR12861 [Rhamnella rubrinervis]|uniref:Glucose/Sorbosone dehydrogenase domain-containing protein n=1 Tax=Rhamnella rubrinervis TaxID=2594499 RepID=A0A8K0ME85_9ROSA|nr:hypothetical protein FNV43_RR12861 [Rhamnella rubrinervis]
MNVSEPGCASVLKSILCSRCDQFSAELYRTGLVPRAVPVLCNSTVSANSTQSQDGLDDFCTKVWNECHNVSLLNAPFTLQSGKPFNSTSKLTDIWKSKSAFCNAFGGSSKADLVCFDGGPVSLNNTETPSPPSGMCLEKIDNGSYLNMVAHPDGSNRIFLSNQLGKIWLETVPEEGSGETLVIDESNLFVDLTDQVYADVELGLMGIAFHPNFKENGRFFASFNCDKVKWTECSGRCSCNSVMGCDPSKLGPDNGAQPCQYHSVIAEFTANGTTAQALVKPQEVRRIFTMGLHLLPIMNKKSLLGKILRLDIDNIPSSTRISSLDLWGNYSVPGDNPFSEDEELLPEIWALGFRNPWRCSFDLERPSYFLCADVGQDEYEEVNMITKGGNYGWRVYEGPFLYNPPKSLGGNTSVASINPIFPVMGYNHSEVNKVEGSASITGGYFYRSMTDPCMHGRYLYADLYGGDIWTGTESPKDSGNFTRSKIPVSCALDSPIQCSVDDGSPLPALGFIFSFGQDNRNDIFILASTGVYRIVPPSRCNYTCPSENVTRLPHPTPIPSPSPLSNSTSRRLDISLLEQLLLFSFRVFVWFFFSSVITFPCVQQGDYRFYSL